MTTLTAQQLTDAQNSQVEGLITALATILSDIEAMKTSNLEGFQIWNGGLPDGVVQLGMQVNGQLLNLRQRFPAIAQTAASEG